MISLEVDRLRTEPALYRELVNLIESQCMKKAFLPAGSSWPTAPTYGTGLIRVT
jgi:hypothetical protein